MDVGLRHLEIGIVQCRATTRSGKRCRNRAIPGKKFCYIPGHAGWGDRCEADGLTTKTGRTLDKLAEMNKGWFLGVLIIGGIFLLNYLESWWKRRKADGRYRPVSEFGGINGAERVTQHMGTFPKPTRQGEKGPSCPRCGSPTVARVSTQTGELYFGCTNFAGGCRFNGDRSH